MLYYSMGFSLCQDFIHNFYIFSPHKNSTCARFFAFFSPFIANIKRKSPQKY